MTLFFDHCGPLLRYERGTLHIEDLNPELKTKWSLSRWEMFKLGFKFLWASVR